MNPDPFEQRLSRQPLCPVPAEWRDEILSPSPISYFQSPTPWWREWLWPCPQAWAALAAVWILALFFHVTTPEVAPAAPRVAMQATPQQLLALLRTGSSPETETSEIRQKPATLPPSAPKPRSERRTFVVAV